MTIDAGDERLPMVTGRGRFLDDITPAGCLHAVFLRSPHASARIVAIETARAEAAPGVSRVLVGSDLADAVAPFWTGIAVFVYSR